MSHYNNEKMVISIVLPTFNVGRHIDRCIASCINQDYEKFEIIIVDDYSSDDSIEKAKYWAIKDSRIRIVRNLKNLGTFHARRIGVESALGQYVLFLDPDDEIEDGALSIIAHSVEKNADLYLYWARESHKGGPNKIKLPLDGRGNVEVLNNIFVDTRFNSYGTSGKIFSRSVLMLAYSALDVNIDDRLVYAEDALLFFAAALHSKSLSSIKKSLYIYHRELSSITKSSGKEGVTFKVQQVYLVVSYLYKILGSNLIKSKTAEMAGKKVIGRLLSDAALIRRYIKDDFGRSQYLHYVCESLRMRRELADCIRLMVYIITFGFMRL